MNIYDKVSKSLLNLPYSSQARWFFRFQAIWLCRTPGT